VLGGKAGARNVFRYEQGDGYHHPPQISKMVGIKIARGQHLRLETPGGGGYGAADQRDPAAVARDVAFGYVTPTSAETDYLVVLDAQGDPDMPATLRLRKAAQS
jgi:N-methylhydantoinase B